MADNSIIDRQFTRQLRAAFRLYDADLLAECEISTRELLNDGDIPRWHRMKALIMLGSIAEDAAEAADCYRTADSLWWMVRRKTPTLDDGKVDRSVDRSLNEIRSELDGLEEALGIRPDVDMEWTEEDDLTAAIAADEEAAAETDDEMELDTADTDEPAMPVEEMRKVTLAEKATAPKPDAKQVRSTDNECLTEY
jgi:hypothetical protein